LGKENQIQGNYMQRLWATARNDESETKMNISQDVILRLQSSRFFWLYPIQQITDTVLGLLHGFPLCCIAQFVWESITENYSEPTVYDDDKGLQYCKYHSTKIKRSKEKPHEAKMCALELRKNLSSKQKIR